MTDEETKMLIVALLAERKHYELYDQPDRVKQVDAELYKLGHKAKPPAKRATRMKPKARTEL